MAKYFNIAEIFFLPLKFKAKGSSEQCAIAYATRSD